VRARRVIGIGLLFLDLFLGLAFSLKPDEAALAQSPYVGRGFAGPPLPPYEALAVLRAAGFTPLTRPVRRGPNYVLLALDRAGRQMYVAVDAHLGDIVNIHRPLPGEEIFGPQIAAPNAGRPLSPSPPDAAAAPPPRTPRPGEETGPPPLPPRNVPNGAVASVPPPETQPGPPQGTLPGALPPSQTPPPAPTPSRASIAVPELPPPPPLPRPRPTLNAGAGATDALAPSAGAKDQGEIE
jgi:hypothetical protein